MARRQCPLRVLIYTRTCARPSVEPAGQRSADAQAELLRAHAASLGWQTVSVYASDEAGYRMPWDRRQP